MVENSNCIAGMQQNLVHCADIRKNLKYKAKKTRPVKFFFLIRISMAYNFSVLYLKTQSNCVAGTGPHIQKHVFPMILLPNVLSELMVTNVLFHFQALVQGMH